MRQVAPEGFPNWSHLFEYLKENGFADQQRVALVYPTDQPTTLAETNAVPNVIPAAREVELYLDEIKARAFEEIYERLPTIASVSVLVEMVESHAHAGRMTPVVEFLNKLPKRSE